MMGQATGSRDLNVRQIEGRKRLLTVYRELNTKFRLDVFPFVPIYIVLLFQLFYYQYYPTPETLVTKQCPWLPPSSETCTLVRLTSAGFSPNSPAHYFPFSLTPYETHETSFGYENRHKFLLSETFALDTQSACFGSEAEVVVVGGGCDGNCVGKKRVDSNSGEAYLSFRECEQSLRILTPEAGMYSNFIIGVLVMQLLVWLSGEWSLRCRCALRFRNLNFLALHTIATHVLVEPKRKNKKTQLQETYYEAQLCKLEKVAMQDGKSIMYFMYFNKKFIYDESSPDLFETLVYPTGLPASFYLSSKGLVSSDKEHVPTTMQRYDSVQSSSGLKKAVELWGASKTLSSSLLYYGKNEYEILLPTFRELFQEQAVSPFFVFQCVCVLLWLLDDYWQYGLMSLVMLVVLEAQLAKKRLKEIGELRQMRMGCRPIPVYRDGGWKSLPSSLLLPGDICSISRSSSEQWDVPGNRDPHVCPADCLILQGTAIMNESMLSGESIPQMKVPIDCLLNLESGGEQLLDIVSDHKQSAIFAGTSVVLHNNKLKTYTNTSGGVSTQIRNIPPGCLCYVLRTGFQTTQGKLVRTILHSAERVTVSSKEALYFLLLLVFFALAAAGYVLYYASRTERSTFKLLLSCSHIITAVVPPEFPITLSLAITLSLVSLFAKKIYCTEPFRIPFAGIVDTCAFDKTGTLTSDKMEVMGIFDIKGGEKSVALTYASGLVLGGCQSLAKVGGELIGDPLEKAAFIWAGWRQVDADNIVGVENGAVLQGPLKAEPKKESQTSSFDSAEAVTVHSTPGEKLKIRKRFPFSSVLQRTTAVVGHEPVGHVQAIKELDKSNSQTGAVCWVLSKGSPEKMQHFLTLDDSKLQVYRETFETYATMGYRVLAMGIKSLSTDGDVSNREDLEKDLQFAGFLVLQCPLKPNTGKYIATLKSSGHRVIMITGDSALTACQVAYNLDMQDDNSKPFLILDIHTEGQSLTWRFRGSKQNTSFEKSVQAYRELAALNSLCITGPAISELTEMIQGDKQHWFDDRDSVNSLSELFRKTTIFARVSPQQKQLIISLLNEKKEITLMCGDGTNDVGALKAAHVGVSLLGAQPLGNSARSGLRIQARGKVDSEGTPRAVKPMARQTNSSQKSLQEQLEAMEDKAPVVKLGEASIASPFTFRGDSIRCIPTIVRAGRGTLTTVIMMYKLMALNSLVTAFAFSVLTLDGVKFGNFQTMAENLFATILQLMLSKTRPVQAISQERPVSSIFEPSVLISLFGQAAVHLGTLVLGWQMACNYRPGNFDPDVDGIFKPNIVNTVVFYLIASMHASSFLCNYEGAPFMPKLTENKPMVTLLLLYCVFVLVSVTEILPGLNYALSLVPAPEASFKWKLTFLVVVDIGLSWLIAYASSSMRLLFQKRKNAKKLLEKRNFETEVRVKMKEGTCM